MAGPFSTIDVICARRQALIYVSPPFCEVDFSSSGEPVIVLNPFRRRRGPTGFVIITGGRIRFRWDTTDGAICYSLYRREGGEYVLVAECVPCEACVPPAEGECCYECEDCPPGCYAITAITEDGETEPSNEACSEGCDVTITTSSLLPSATEGSPYSQQLAQEGGTPESEEWTIVAGALPNGLTLSSSGLISGTPTEGGTFFFTANVFAMCSESSASEDEKEFQLSVSFIPTGCPAEIGTPTTCNFETPVSEDLGEVFVADITVLNETVNFGNFAMGKYKIEYVEGCYSHDSTFGPDPSTCYTTLGHVFLYPSSNSLDAPFSGSDLCDPPEVGAGCADIAAQMAGVESSEVYASAGDFQLQYTGWGGYDTLTRHNGSPNPTWRLRRTGSFPIFPVRLRIMNFDPDSFANVCGTAAPSVDPEWAGDFPTRILTPPDFFTWVNVAATSLSLNGLELRALELSYTTTTPGGGCGWVISIRYSDIFNNSVEGWRGFKQIGNSPVGRYYQFSGCQTGPDCLLIEEY